MSLFDITNPVEKAKAAIAEGVIANGGGVPVPAEGIGRGCTVPPAAAE